MGRKYKFYKTFEKEVSRDNDCKRRQRGGGDGGGGLVEAEPIDAADKSAATTSYSEILKINENKA